ncbi:RlpA-like double-psi beta-barrel domain-containing protein [Ornithinibacillus bavariensis]|uniref:DUF3889 domain-containing protein n=1 Tax=Ornithinibacillus bavariensis TaxID=545502 RepID=A0A920C4S1_9BACI|nr:RlpA-like double-psi beta-barrel domain-containing protein [Ornithinibacillus bavariensis]GIO25930.1 hypothetical protein J43TS3_05410 [Ornithinibacillus bavariensis]
MYYQQPNYYYGYYPYPVYPVPAYRVPEPIPTDEIQRISGEATWTMGGESTQCGFSWSTNNYMTVAVGNNSPYTCGQRIRVRNPENGKAINATVVDTVHGFPNNRINLHRRAFEALGANPNQGILHIEIEPVRDEEEGRKGEYLQEIVQTAFSQANVRGYDFLGKTEDTSSFVTENYNFFVQTNEGDYSVRGTVSFHPESDQIAALKLEII